ncbi:MAG: hypothetical protein DWQ10_14800 [Calditrichaeota bacterium]|nr:MAG: hypothetical protein DWQ10_14800 [Calditrichota bacterium]
MIVFSVLLALGLNEYRSNYKDKLQKTQALKKIENELQTNLEIVEELEPYHNEVLQNIRDAIKSNTNLERFFTGNRNDLARLMPRGILWRLIDDTAWDALKTSKIFSDIELDTMVELSKIYKLQNIGVSMTINSISDIIKTRELLRKENARETLILLRNGFAELVSQEKFLINHYREILKKLAGTD